MVWWWDGINVLPVMLLASYIGLEFRQPLVTQCFSAAQDDSNHES